MIAGHARPRARCKSSSHSLTLHSGGLTYSIRVLMAQRPPSLLLFRVLVLILLVLFFSAAVAPHASANLAPAQVVVTSTADSGPNTLRQALIDVPSGGTITFNLPSPSTITLSTGVLVVNKTMTITGPGAANLTIDANYISRVISVTTGVTLNLQNITLKQGASTIPAEPLKRFARLARAPQPKGGVSAQVSDGFGGAIYNLGTLGVTNSTFLNNYAVVSDIFEPEDEMFAAGGAIYSEGPALNITGCTFSGNAALGPIALGGAIANAGGSLTIGNSLFSGNGAGGLPDMPDDIPFPMIISAGGAIATDRPTTITNSTFQGNLASGLFALGGALGTIDSTTISGSTLSGNNTTGVFSIGGGLVFLQFDAGTLAVSNSTFSGNNAGVIPDSGDEAGIGGAAAIMGQANITHTTIADNTAASEGGGIVLELDAPIPPELATRFPALATTRGLRRLGNIRARRQQATITLRSTIVANNTPDNCAAAVPTNGGNNLQFGGTAANSCGPTIPTANPLLGALANNGGSTQTRALQAGSAALDKIPNAGGCGVGITADQRGISRPQPAGGLCDIGAYEQQQAAQAAAPKEVPEAGSLLLIGSGLGGLATWLGWQRRRLKR